MKASIVIQSQLLATKFFVPSVSHAVIDRPRLQALLLGLQLLGLSLREPSQAITLLEKVSGNQRYILDYFTEEIFQRNRKRYRPFCSRRVSSNNSVPHFVILPWSSLAVSRYLNDSFICGVSG